MDSSSVSDYEDSSVSPSSSSVSPSSSSSDCEMGTVDQELQLLKQKMDANTEKEKLAESKTKPRSKVTPGTPKRKRTAYTFFSKHIRPSVKQENPSFTFAEISKCISSKWASLTQEEKKPFEEQVVADQKRWEEEMKKFTEGNKKSQSVLTKQIPGVAGKSPRTNLLPPDTQLPSTEKKPKKKSRKRKIPKDPNMPKKPLSQYNMYLREKHGEIKQRLIQENGSKVTEADVMRQVGESWRNLPPEEKEYYTRKSQEDNERYKLEMYKYEEKKKLNAAKTIDDSEEERPPKKKKTQKKTQKKKTVNGGEENKSLKQKILKVRAKGEDYFDRIVLKQYSLNKLIQTIQEKRQDFRPITLVIQLPNVRIRDNQDVLSLYDHAELEVIFGESEKLET